MSSIAFPILNRDDRALQRRRNLQWKLKPGNLVSFLSNGLVSADDRLVVAAGPCLAETPLRYIEVINYGFRMCSPQLEDMRGIELPCEASIAAPDRISDLGSNLDASGAASPKIC